MAPEALERIWASFEQEDSSTIRSYGGTGLGTTIAKQLVELMGGRIDVASIKGRGTTFWFELPFRLQMSAPSLDTVVRNPRLLLLSNDTGTANYLQQILNEVDGKVMSAKSEADAIAALGRGMRLGNPWHAVLVDKHLPETITDAQPTPELSSKASLIQTPVYLLSDSSLGATQLCEWGYASTLPLRPTREMLFSAIHASPLYEYQAGCAGMCGQGRTVGLGTKH